MQGAVGSAKRGCEACSCYAVGTEFETPAFLDNDVGMGHGKIWIMDTTSMQEYSDIGNGEDEFLHNFSV
jgi:hypothetical protein